MGKYQRNISEFKAVYSITRMLRHVTAMTSELYLKKNAWIVISFAFCLAFFLLDELFLSLLTYFPPDKHLLLHRSALFIVVAAFIYWSQHALHRFAKLHKRLKRSTRFAILGEEKANKQRRQTEDARAALQVMEEQFRLVVEYLPNGILLVNSGGTITLVNRKVQTLFGYTRDELIGQSVEMLVPESLRTRHTDNRIRYQADPRTVMMGDRDHFTARLKDGSEIPVEVGLNPIETQEGKMVHCTIVDLTERMRIEEELLKIAKLESVNLMASKIAHDLNNILTLIIGNFSVAKTYDDPVERDNAIAEAEKASFRVKDLTSQLLTFSQGGSPITMPADIGELVKESAIFALRGSKVEGKYSIADDIWTVEIDTDQINQVINNLIINADQAMSNGGTIEFTVSNHRLENGSDIPLDAGKYVRVSVHDQGSGIPSSDLAKIFDPFFTTKSSGSGLGLANAFSIIQNHHGHIIVDSELGVGTRIDFYLPASNVQKLTISRNKGEELIHGTGRILVMDDIQSICKLVKKMLGRLGYEVATARNGNEAIEMYKASMDADQMFDVVILDLTVPGGMGGKETLKQLKQINPEVRAIVSSGYSHDSTLVDSKRYGFQGSIGKPYKMAEFSRVLHDVISI